MIHNHNDLHEEHADRLWKFKCLIAFIILNVIFWGGLIYLIFDKWD